MQVRRTVVVHTILAGHMVRVDATRRNEAGVQVMTMGQLAARLAGGLLQPIDLNVLTETVRDTLPDVEMGELEPIKDLPGMPAALEFLEHNSATESQDIGLQTHGGIIVGYVSRQGEPFVPEAGRLAAPIDRLAVGVDVAYRLVARTEEDLVILPVGGTRHLVIDVEPDVPERELLRTIRWSCEALLGVIVASNEICGGNQMNDAIRQAFDELSLVLKPDLDGPDTTKGSEGDAGNEQ
jgi:hypothetical protein